MYLHVCVHAWGCCSVDAPRWPAGSLFGSWDSSAPMVVGLFLPLTGGHCVWLVCRDERLSRSRCSAALLLAVCRLLGVLQLTWVLHSGVRVVWDMHSFAFLVFPAAGPAVVDGIRISTSAQMIHNPSGVVLVPPGPGLSSSAFLEAVTDYCVCDSDGGCSLSMRRL